MEKASSNGHTDEMIRVLIADDHALVRAGMCMILEDEPGIEVVGEAADGAEALDMALALKPDVVLADISMPPPDGIELARLLRHDLPASRVVVVTMHEDSAMARDALASGAAGYVVKRAESHELLLAIHRVAAGEIYIDQEMRRLVAPELSEA